MSTRQPVEASERRTAKRIGGVDAARAVAVIGMVMVHFGPTGAAADGPAGSVYILPHGRASILFVLLAGVGVTLLGGDRSPARRRASWERLGVRAAMLAPLGLALQLLDHKVLVILQYYALYFLVAAAALRLSDRALLASSFGTLVAGPVLYLAAWHRWPAWFDDDATVLTDPPAEIVRDLLLSGTYPVITWSAPLLFGMWLGRRTLRDPATLRRMIVVGSAVALAALAASQGLEAWFGVPEIEPTWWQLTSDEPHSQMPLWLLGAAAAATAVLAACVWLVDRLPRLSWPLVATGQLALTVYVAHLLLLSAWPELLQRDTVPAASWSVARFAVVVALVATAWRALFSYGPLEFVLRFPPALQPPPRE